MSALESGLVEIYDESDGLSLASGEVYRDHFVNINLGSLYPQKSPFLEWQVQLVGPKGPSQESPQHGDLVQTTHFMEETMAQRR